MSSAHTFYDFLRSAIRDRGATALSSVADCAANNREVEIKGPCFAALACWGDAGFKKAIEIATKHTSSKNISASIKLLATISAKKSMSSMMFFIQDKAIEREIDEYISNKVLAEIARKRLAELIMTLPSDDLLIPLGVVFSQIALDQPSCAEERSVAGEIVAALSSKWIGFGQNEIKTFEEILNNKPDDEPSLHAFLENFPQMLDPMAIQVWSKPDFHGFKEPDFLIRRSDDTYVVVEIENAKKPLVTQADQPSVYVTQAVKQVNDYRTFILERITEARHHFPNIHEPDALVVIGLEKALTPSQAKALKQENHSRSKLRIAGFDWILERSKTVLANVTASKVEVIKGHRVV